MMSHILVVSLILLAQASNEPSSETQRFELDGAVLLLPASLRLDQGPIDVIVHFHGAEAVVERALAESGRAAAVVVVNRKGLSSAYSVPFSRPEAFDRLMDETRAALRGAGMPESQREGKWIVSSFSAGFGAVRELLKQPEHFRRIDAVILADSLYCGYQNDRRDQGLDPERMAAFRRFAEEAASGRKALVLTHSAQVPEGYGSTTETADALIAHVGARACERAAVGGWTPTRCLSVGRFLVVGYPGSDGEAHMQHLRRLGLIWRLAHDAESASFAAPQDSTLPGGPKN